MRIYSSHKHIPEKDRGTVMAIGNFDGLHRGHAALIKEAREIANAHGKRMSVLTFEPHPRQVFQHAGEPFRLTPGPVKSRLMRDLGVDVLYTLKFDATFSLVSAEDFVSKYLVDGYHVHHVVVGRDFQFGQGRSGDIELLRKMSRDYRFGLTAFEKVTDSNFNTYSSSAVREALRNADIVAANQMLGWKWEIEGKVVNGDKRGRELGYPTANVELGEYLRPSFGVYAVRVAVDDFARKPQWLMGAANIGIRPMFETPTPLLEVHILDYNKEIYGHTLRAQLVKKLRDEEKFDSLDALKDQMAKDCEDTRRLLAASDDSFAGQARA